MLTTWPGKSFPADRAAAISAGASDSAFDQHRLNFGDGLGRIEAFGASLGAIENGVAAIQSKRVFEIIEPRPGRFIAAVDDPAARLQQRGGPEIAIAVPPIAGAAAAAAGAQDALVETVELGAIFLALAPFGLRRGTVGLKPGFDRGVLRVEHGEIGHQVLDDRQVRQRVDSDLALDVVDTRRARKPVGAVDVHGAASADALATRATEGQRGIDLVLDEDQGIEHHRPAILKVDDVGVDARIVAVVGIEAINAEFLGLRGARRRGPGLARGDLGIFRQRNLDHDQYTRFRGSIYCTSLVSV